MILSVALISHLIVALTILFLGIIVYFHDRKSVTNRVLFLHTLIITFWAISNYFSISVAPDEALFWIRLVIFFAVPHVFLFFFFVYVFPEREVKVKTFPATVYFILLLLTSLIALSPYGFKGIELIDNHVTPVRGPLMPLLGIVIILISVLTVFILIDKYRKAEILQKKQYASIFIGLASSYFLLITLVFLAVNVFKLTYFVQFSSFFILPMILGSVYAILRHHLLNVKVIATELLTYAIFVILLFQVLLSKELADGIVRMIILTLFLPFGVFLIRSVLREVEQREKLEVLTEKLQKTDQLKTEYFRIATHDMKSPLAIIKGFAELLIGGTIESEKMKDTFSKVREQAMHGIQLSSRLLDAEKMEVGKMEYNMADVDIVQLVRGITEDNRIIAEKKGLTLTFNSATNDIHLNADKERIYEVFQNLIGNAIKYTEKGGVEVSVEKNPETILFTIKDTGRGMSRDLQARLFQKFVRDETTAKEVQGTGLGLYIAKSIVEAHHGKIWAESEGEGKGSKFFIELFATGV